MDIEDIDKQAKKVGGLLTTIENIWKKHWKTLFVLAVLAPVVWFCSLVVEEVDNPTPYTEEYIGADAQYNVEDDYYIGTTEDTIYMLNDTIK